MTWPLVRVGDLVAEGVLALNDGYRVTNRELGPTGIPFVRGGDIGDHGEINTNVADHVLPEFHDRITTKLTRPGDVAFITKGSVGRVGFLRDDQPRAVFAPQVCYWRSLDAKRLDASFIFYLLSSATFQANLDAVKTHGSMVADYVSLSDQKLFRLPLPAIGVQRAVARVLGALDDKIELNRKMNNTLHAIARAVFQSWFVDFGPVRAKMEGRSVAGMDYATTALFPDAFEETKFGVLPTGWARGRLGDVIEIFDSQRVPLSAREREQRPGPYPYYGAASAMDRVDAYLFEGPHVLVGEDGSVVNDDGSPVLQYVDGKFWVNNHAHVLLGRCGITPEHLLLLLERVDVRPYVTGAVQPKLNQANLCAVPIVVPAEPVNVRFGCTIAPFFAAKRALIRENDCLGALRDALLPKLMSGETRVRDAERAVEAAT